MRTVGTTNASTRAEWIIKSLKSIPAGLTLLDAGAGIAPYKSHCGHLKYIAQDFGKYDGKGDIGIQTGVWDNSNLDIVSDIISIPLPGASIDVILCTEVFEHIPDPIQAIREFSRLLKPGGILILTAPFCSLTHFAPFHFYTGFNRFFYEKYLPENKLSIQEMQFNGNYFEYLGQEIRRIGSIAGRYAGSKLSLLEKLFLKGSLWTLERLSKKDKNSSELLNYGIHVFARKMES
jgi:SAM-dependent methyltransferase